MPMPRVTLDRRPNQVESFKISKTLRISLGLWEERHGKRKPANLIWELTVSQKSNSGGEHHRNCRSNCGTPSQCRDTLPVPSLLAFGHTRESRNDSAP